MGYYIGDDQQMGLAEKLFFADGGAVENSPEKSIKKSKKGIDKKAW